ncbi:DUF1836 domain-containing protein [Clostridium sp. 19966]|uniref:DUF1836 domain-containing protein n=1 Tax=Clostridium sp. 19966 TaxID=2768166 RepID=UPI0028DEBE97|nr:DUF1836 domain-containing protein [Clostridium sp. 19966]MDT8715407.1 DUF1836 domain-containing protein [Clostridium sp. 19966]
MNKLEDMLKGLNIGENITLEELPKIDLYMDQVIQIFEGKFSDSIRNEEEKILTKTMINNYAKNNLMIPIKNKKYSLEHLILISIIYQLKGALSINDIKNLLTPINDMLEKDKSFSIKELYSSYLNLFNQQVKEFSEDIMSKAKDVEEELKDKDSLKSDFTEKFLLITSFITMSNFYRRIAEKIIDDVTSSGDK